MKKYLGIKWIRCQLREFIKQGKARPLFGGMVEFMGRDEDRMQKIMEKLKEGLKDFKTVKQFYSMERRGWLTSRNSKKRSIKWNKKYVVHLDLENEHRHYFPTIYSTHAMFYAGDLDQLRVVMGEAKKILKELRVGIRKYAVGLAGFLLPKGECPGIYQVFYDEKYNQTFTYKIKLPQKIKLT